MLGTFFGELKSAAEWTNQEVISPEVDALTKEFNTQMNAFDTAIQNRDVAGMANIYVDVDGMSDKLMCKLPNIFLTKFLVKILESTS